MIPIIVLAVNAFWWLPGIWLASTKGESGFAFAHPEGVMQRLVEIVNSSGVESPVQSILLAAGLPGLFLIWRRSALEGWALIGFCAAGRILGIPGRGVACTRFLAAWPAHLCVLHRAGGCRRRRTRRAASGGCASVLDGVDHLDRWVMAGLVLVGIRMFGYPLIQSLRARLACNLDVEFVDWRSKAHRVVHLRSGPGEPFLSSRPSPRLHLGHRPRPAAMSIRARGCCTRRGERPSPACPIRFKAGDSAAFCPNEPGVEVIGGPYLHASLKTNFTQFGEGKLFGRADWDRDLFRPIRQAIPSVGHIVLESARAAILSGKP